MRRLQLPSFLLLLILVFTVLWIDPGCALGLVYARRLVFEAGSSLLLLLVLLLSAKGVRLPASFPAWAALLFFLAVRVPAAPLTDKGLAVFFSCFAFFAFRVAAGFLLDRDSKLTGYGVTALCWAGLLVSLVALAQYSGFHPVATPFYLARGKGLIAQRRLVFSLFGNPLLTASFLAALLPLVTGRALRGNGVWAAVTLPFYWGAILATYCRAAIVAAAAGQAMVMSCSLQGCQKTRRRLILVAAVTLAAFSLFSGFNRYRQGLGTRLLSVGAKEDRGRCRRETEWSVAWTMFRRKPFTGMGPATFPARQVFEMAYLYQGDEHARRFHITRWAHNDYLQCLAEHGILGLLLVGLVAASETAGFCSVFSRMKTSSEYCSLVSALVVVLLSALVYFPFSRPEILVLAAFCVAGLAESRQDGRQDGRQRQHSSSRGLHDMAAAVSAFTCGACLVWALGSYRDARLWQRAETAWRSGSGQEAVEYFMRMSRGLFRHRDQAQRDWAALALEKGRMDSAALAVRDAIASCPVSGDVSVLAAVEAYRNGPAAAVEVIDDWIVYFPLSAELRANKGVYLFQSGELEKAQRMFVEAIVLGPDLAWLRSNLSKVLDLRVRRREITRSERDKLLRSLGRPG